MKILAVPISRSGIFISSHRPQWLSQPNALLCSGRSSEETHLAVAKTFHKEQQHNYVASSSHSLLPSFSCTTLQLLLPACSYPHLPLSLPLLFFHPTLIPVTPQFFPLFFSFPCLLYFYLICFIVYGNRCIFLWYQT